MFSRRNLRIKVLQQLYAIRYNPDTEVKAHKLYLKNSLESVRIVYTYSLMWMLKVADQVLDDKKYREGKRLPNAEDQSFTTKLYDNPFLVEIRESQELKDAINQYKLASYLDQDIVAKLYRDLRKDELYRKYAASPERSTSANRNIVLHLWKRIILGSSTWVSHVEDHWITWNDDRNLIVNGLIATINDFYSKRYEITEGFQLKAFDWKEVNLYTGDLLDKTLENKENFDKIIEPILKNWEADRINPMDQLIMHMALCELLHFPSIPVKVTINEYIELSKIYSTPKSKDFINGVLDTAKARLEKKGEILKVGRGLK